MQSIVAPAVRYPRPRPPRRRFAPSGALAAGLAGAALVGYAHAAELGDDGLHEQAWFVDSFRDVAEDIELAADEGRRLLILYEQRGCPYCAKLHATLLDDPEVRDAVLERFDVVQYDLAGATEVTDLDGTAMTESSAAERWDIRFTPTMVFLPEPDGLAPDAATVRDAALAVLPGVPERDELLDALERFGPGSAAQAR